MDGGDQYAGGLPRAAAAVPSPGADADSLRIPGEDTCGIRIEVEGPLILVTYRGHTNDTDYARYLEELTRTVQQAADRYPRVAQVHDASEWRRSTPAQRRMQIEWIRHQAPLLQRQGGTCAFVVRSSFVRSGVTAVTWLVRTPSSYRVFTRPDKAIAWAQERLREPDWAPGQTVP